MTIYDFYEELLKDLFVQDYTYVRGELITNNYCFYSDYKKLNKKANISSIKTINYDTLIINEYDEEYRSTYSIYNSISNDISNNISNIEVIILLFIFKNDKYVYIEPISYYQSNPKLELPKTKESMTVFKKTLAFIESIKNKHDLKYIEFKDNCKRTFFKNIKVNDSNYKLAVPLTISNLTIFTKGKTWPEKYGFDMIEKYEYTNQMNVLAKNTSVEHYLLKASKYICANNDKTIEFYETHKRTNISNFIVCLIEDLDNGMLLFNLICEDIMDELYIDDLTGKEYRKNL